MTEYFTQNGMMIAVLLLAVVTIIATTLVFRHIRTINSRLAAAEQLAEQLLTDVRGLCSGAVGAAKRVNRVEGVLRMQKERIERVELHEPGEQSYLQAVRMAKKGAPVEELVETCGLSRGEAEFILMLNNHSAVAHH